MTASKPLDIDTLLKIDRTGNPVVAPDGSAAVCTVTSMSIELNKGSTSLWLLPTDRCTPRRLTRCGEKDAQPAWSPQGDRIAFIAQREQEGRKDVSPQLYVIGARGGEARRVSDFGPGVEAFKWMPDGRHVVFVSWVWPELRGRKAQDRRHKSHRERKDSGYVTSEANYRDFDKNLPMGRVPHLLQLDLENGHITDLFEGGPHELVRRSPGPADFDIAPDGRRIVFAHDPTARKLPGNPLALAELELKGRRVTPLTDDAGWSFDAPRYSPDGQQIACIASHVGVRHTMPGRLALLRRGQPWRTVGDGWDGDVDAPLRWTPDGRSLLFTAERSGRRPLWRFDLDRLAYDVLVPGGWVQGFDLGGAVAAETLVVAADSATHPVRVHAQRAGGGPLRLERFNDALLAGRVLNPAQEVFVTGALGQRVQMLLTHPPGFDPQEEVPAAARRARRPACGRGRHLRLPLEHPCAGLARACRGPGQLSRLERFWFRLPRQHHGPPGRARNAGHRSVHRLGAGAALGRCAAGLPVGWQLWRLPGGLDEWPCGRRVATRPTSAMPACSTGSPPSRPTPTCSGPRTWGRCTGRTWPRCSRKAPATSLST